MLVLPDISTQPQTFQAFHVASEKLLFHTKLLAFHFWPKDWKCCHSDWSTRIEAAATRIEAAVIACDMSYDFHIEHLTTFVVHNLGY